MSPTDRAWAPAVPRALSAPSVVALARRPDLWLTAGRQWAGLVPSRWWSEWPYLPVPAKAYLSFRLEAMFGPARTRLGSQELIGYLQWCRWMRYSAR